MVARGKLQPPFILIEERGVSVLLFPSLEGAESYCEAVDVADGLYEIFDATGLKGRLDAFDQAVVADFLNAPMREELLVAYLRRVLAQIQVGVGQSDSLEVLLSRAAPLVERPPAGPVRLLRRFLN